MKLVSHSILALVMVMLITVHLFLLVVIVYPVQKMIRRSVGHEISYTPLYSIPDHVRQMFEMPDRYEPSLSFEGSSLFDSVLTKSFAFRKNKIFDRRDEEEFYLNTLDFGGEVRGVDDASKYYFAKSVVEVSESEAITLMSMQKIFMN